MRAVAELCRHFARLPGLGPRSAQRIVLALLQSPDEKLTPLIDALQSSARTITVCETCGNLDDQSPCRLCTAAHRDPHKICVVERVEDLWAFERGGHYDGLYHVLGGRLSVVDKCGSEQLRLASLARRVAGNDVREVILATGLTVEGQVTAHYIQELLMPLNVHLSRLAHGVPMGGDLDYLDDATLKAALELRRDFK